MSAPFPHHYQTKLVRTLGSRARIEAPPRAAIAGGPPPEFDGDATSWSPEHLLLTAIGLCLQTTFEAFCARDRVELLAWEATVNGTLSKSAHGLAFSELRVDVDMEVSDVARAQRTLEDARKHCIISNALRTPVEIAANIKPAQLRAG